MGHSLSALQPGGTAGTPPQRRRISNSSNKHLKVSKKQRYEYQEGDWPWVWAIRNSQVLDWKKGLSDKEIQIHQQQQENNLPVHIYGNVYLGNAASVQDIQTLQKLQIGKVLNMAGSIALKSSTIQAFAKHGIVYKRITALDAEYYPLLERDWEEAYAFIHGHNDDNIQNENHPPNVVVHCVAGVNRSALVVATDYMLTCQKDVLETVRHVRKQRGNVALQNEYFQEQLVAMARQHNLLGPTPGTNESVLVPSNVVIPPQVSHRDESKRRLLFQSHKHD